MIDEQSQVMHQQSQELDAVDAARYALLKRRAIIGLVVRYVCILAAGVCLVALWTSRFSSVYAWLCFGLLLFGQVSFRVLVPVQKQLVKKRRAT